MADGEAEPENGSCPDLAAEMPRLEERLLGVEGQLRAAGAGGGEDEAVQAASDYCQRFCQTLLEFAEKWKASEDSLPLLEVYMVAIHSYSNARPYLTSQCENVSLVLERLALSCVELLLCLPQELPDDHWQKFQGSIKAAHERLTENGSHELLLLYNMSQEAGVWKDPVLGKILNSQIQDPRQVTDVFLCLEGPLLLEMRIKRLLKLTKVAEATSMAKLCSDHPEMSKKGHFKQLYLKCLCAASPNIKLIEEIAKVDCKDALEMICNLESEGDEKTSLILCAAFLSRQLQFGEMYCAWELTLFWSKLQRRVEPSIQVYLEICRQLSQLTKTVYHIFFLIKVIQSETEAAGLPTCIELCVRALRLESSENAKVKISICKTISCLLPDDLEVKRACQLTEFLLEPTVDAYYAVEMLYNQPDQKYDEESLPVPNSLRCELLLVLKTRWPFDPEFWDWKTLKRQCLALMGEQASIVSSIDELNDNEAYDQMDNYQELTKDVTGNGLESFDDVPVQEFTRKKQRQRPIKKMREHGYVSARFRNWQAYMQYCVLCDKEFLGHRIIRHAQKHCMDGIYSCPICAKQYTTKETFIPHVTLHVKQSCKERLETMKPLKRLPKLPKKEPVCKIKKPETITKQERQVKKNTLYSDDFIVFNDNDNSDENDDKDKSGNFHPEKPVNEFPCPVQFCNKGFKYFKNLIAHVRGHKDSKEAARFLEIQSKKVVCQYCRRQFVSLTHLNDHLQMHCGSQPYICIQMKCKASFETYTDLLAHRKEHRHFKARCMFPNCGRIFSAAYMLFDHEAQHYNTFTCKLADCGKIFRSQLQLEQHLREHATETALPESSKSGEFTEVTKTTVKIEGIEFEEKLLPGGNVINIKVESLHSANTSGSVITKDSGVPETSLQSQKMATVSTCEMTNSEHLLDQLITPAAHFLPTTNLLTQVLASPSNDHNMLPKAEMLAPTAFPGDLGNFKLPSVPEGFSDLLNQNKLLPSGIIDNVSETPRMTLPGFEVQHLSLFQDGKNSCQDNSSKVQTGVINAGKIKMEGQEQINIMSFNLHNQTSQLCGNNLMSGYEENSKSENILSLSLETSNALSNVLPPVCDVPITPVAPAPNERFKCNVDGCTRIYNSVQSIGKHMKSTHPVHYDYFKTERKNRKKQKPGTSLPPTDEKCTYSILLGPDVPNNSTIQPNLQSTANHNFCNQLQHLPNSVFPTHLENLVNPLLSPVETVMTQEITKHVAETLLSTEVGNLNNAGMTSQIEDLAKVLPMKFENGSDPFLPMPTENDPLPVMSSLSGSTMFSQLGVGADHVLTGSEAANSVFMKEDVDTDASFSKQVDNTDIDASFNLEKSSSMLSNSADKTNATSRPARNKEKRVKHSPRAKFPAIIRDGKFICSRCFRAFTNPRSLGGHLSKRSVCKPHNDYGIPPLGPQDGQPSVLASMILSTSPNQKAQVLPPSPQQTFSSEVIAKPEHFLSSGQPGNESAQYITTAFSHPSVSSFSHNENKANTVKQNFVDSENDGNRLFSNSKSNGCVPSSPQINTVGPSNVAETQAVTTTSSLQDVPSLGTLHANNSVGVHLPGQPINTNNDLRSNPLVNSAVENHDLPKQVSSTRVSVISGPLSSSITPAKKRNSTSKKKKKTDAPVAVEATHELARNILAAVGGNLQMSMDMQPNLMTYGSELLENIAKNLSNADKELFMSCLNESIKASSETQALCQLAVNQEKSKPPNTSECKDADKLDIHKDFRERTFDNLSPAATEVYTINSNGQEPCSALPQNQTAVNGSIDDDLPGLVHNVMAAGTAASPLNKMNIPVCSVSPTQETTTMYDDQVLEIMNLVQHLQLVDSVMLEHVPALEEKCASSEPMPIMSSVIVPNPSHSLVSEQTSEVSSPISDKNIAKPFICREETCNYCAMTKDALFKHYTKVHFYTTDKLEEIKKHQLKFAPFKCVVPSCTKTFTRNSNLRAHCQAMHNFTSEEMVKLKIKRPYGKKSASESNDFSSSEMPNGSPEVKRCAESHDVKVLTKQEPEEFQEFPPVKAEESPKDEVKQPAEMPIKESKPLLLDQKNKRGPKINRKRKEERKRKRAMQKEPKVPQGPTSYKPYRCVHQGCTAAFSIQQSLMLHYQAVHKPEASKFSEVDLKNEPEEGDSGIQEFRCTETDCSRIFATFASLIQHYVKLHEMIADEIENVVSSASVGKFNCDQSQCTATFTTCTSYIEHLEDAHGLKMKQVKFDGEEMYKCDIKGCDRVYATRSNLLRHIFHKHKDKHKEHLIRPRKMSIGEQENTEEKIYKERPRVPKQKSGALGNEVPKTKRCKGSKIFKDVTGKTEQMKPGPLTLKYGRHTYSLKDKDATIADCPESNTKQYPCMIRGCTSVVASEHNIIRHYKSHKLSRPFISRYKKTLVVCKRRSRSPAKVIPSPSIEPAVTPTKPDITEATVLSTDTQQKQSNPSVLESGDESTISNSQQSENDKDEMDELTELFISKLSNEDSSGSENQATASSCVSNDLQETSSCHSEPQRTAVAVKRTNKQKQATPNKKRKVATSETQSAESSCALDEETIVTDTAPEDTPAFDLSSFKPMGFEVSFLKFIEESVVKEKKTIEKPNSNMATQAEQQPIEEKPQVSEDEDSDSNIYLVFANPSQLPNVEDVKIVLVEAFNDYIELVVKQLNELKPAVILKKHPILRDESASISKEQNVDLDSKITL
ncbi:PREDICTED: zinc finger protein 292 [Nanorana parkeri]|uniref:zinc finger protein 292 n=1 Tax=Nanorana parkeri TaxID=125878 RepID=UPI0008542464|nr:PREDICTED: zinc finger protein 292 [Nanorana parkeri]